MTDLGHVGAGEGLRDQSGYAMPIVLVFLGIVAAISARFVGEARLELDMQKTIRDRVALEALARDLTLGFRPSWIERSLDASVTFSCAAEAYDVSLSIWRQDRLTDLNTASADRLAAALAVAGVPAPAAAEVAAEIVRFRSYDPHGRAEAGPTGVANGLKRAPFEAVEELADFDALAEIEPARLRQVFAIGRRTGDGGERDVERAYAVEVQATQRDGPVSASFGAVLSVGPTSPSARLIEIFDPGRTSAFSSPRIQTCPDALARLVAQRSEVREMAR